MKPRLMTYIALIAAAQLCSGAVLAQAVQRESEQRTEKTAVKPQQNAKASPFSMEASVGAQSNSNVSVSELDASTGAEDQAAVLEAEFDYDLALDDSTDLQLGYSLSQTSYDDFSELDLQNHLLTGDVSRDFGSVDAGGALRYVDARLGGHAYLTMKQLSPYASRFFGRKLFVRADYTFSDKDFADLDDRDASTQLAGADLYYFVRGVRSYVVFGYRYKDEDAADSQFDYWSHNLKLRLTQRFRVLERVATLKLGWLFEARDYSAESSAMGARRDDDRNRLQAEIEVPLVGRSFVRLEYEHGAFSSNLDSADYDQDIVTFRVGMRL